MRLSKQRYGLIRDRAIRAFNSGFSAYDGSGSSLSSSIYEGLTLQEATVLRSELARLEMLDIRGEDLPDGCSKELRHMGMVVKLKEVKDV